MQQQHGTGKRAAHLPKYGVQKLAGPIQVEFIAVCVGPLDVAPFAGVPP
jgi:hypothetical protein